MEEDIFLLEVKRNDEIMEMCGLRKDGSYFVLGVVGYEHWFYVKKAEAASRVPVLNGLKVLECKRRRLYGYSGEEEETLLRIQHPLSLPQSRIVDNVTKKLKTYAIEDGLPVWRRFFIDYNLAAGAWFRIQDRIESIKPNYGQCHISQIQGLAPNLLSTTGSNEFTEIPALSMAYFRIMTKSGRDDSWRPNAKCLDAIRLIVAEAWLSNKLLNRSIFSLDTLQSEAAIIKSFEDWVARIDPDALICFDNRSLGLLASRAELFFKRSISFSRAVHQRESLKVTSVTTYSKEWIRSSSERRMACPNNLETHRILSGTRGRISIDILRFLLMRQQPKLTRYTLPEAVAAILPHAQYNTIPAILPSARAALSTHQASRLMLAECRQLVALSETLRIVPELIESARVTGLDFTTIHWQAASVRTEQLLLKTAKILNYALPLRKAPSTFTAPWDFDTTPYLHHPAPFSDLQPHQQALIHSGFMGHSNKLHGSYGLYQDPVAVLDFASLYPSIFIAHNICYSTLYTKDKEDSDEKACSDKYHTCPGGKYTFVDADTRLGLLPRLLSGLLTKRAAAKRALKDAVARGDAQAAECLEARQLALKMCANATYGYTGSEVSSLQAKPLAEACLRWGNAYCRAAAARIMQEEALSYRVIYAQTDSMFVLLPNCSGQYDKAMTEGKKLAELVTESLGMYPVRLEFERVLQPFLLVQVNRYAGVERPTNTLHIKGIGVERGATLFVRRVLKSCLDSALVRRNVAEARSRAEDAAAALLGGEIDVDLLTFGAFLWRQDHDDIKRMSLGEKEMTKADLDALKTQHVALAARLLKIEPLRTFRLGEFVPLVISFRPDASAATQSDNAMDPYTVLRRGLPVNLVLYLEKKLRPELDRLFNAMRVPAPTHYRPIASPGVLAVHEASKFLGDEEPPQETHKSIHSHFLLASNSQQEFSPEYYLKLIAAKRRVERHWTALLADRHRSAARIFGNNLSAHDRIAEHAAPLANLARLLSDLDRKLDAFTPSKIQERTPLKRPADLGQNSVAADKLTPPTTKPRLEDLPTPRNLFPSSPNSETPWACRLCTYEHVHPSQFPFLSCAICGSTR